MVVEKGVMTTTGWAASCITIAVSRMTEEDDTLGYEVDIIVIWLVVNWFLLMYSIIAYVL